MKLYVEKVKRPSGIRYRIVRDWTRDGVRRRSYKMLPAGTKKAEADRICCQMSLNIEYGDYLDKEKMMFREYYEQVYREKYMEFLSPTTRQNYEQMYSAEDGIRHHLGELFLSEITSETIQDMVNHYTDKGKSPKTIRNHVSFVSVVLKQAVSDNYLKPMGVLPTTYVRLPRQTKSTEGHTYTMEQVTIVLSRAKKEKNVNIELIVGLTCLGGGLRRSELAGLKWEDISLDEENPYILIQRAEVSTKEGMIEKGTKTEAGTRRVPLVVNGTLYKILVRARKKYLRLQAKAPEFHGDNHVLILHHDPYTPMKPNRIYKTFKSFMQKSCPDLPCYRLHDLRHTYFSLCSSIEGFSDLSMISMGGHSSIKSSRRYQHSIQSRVKADAGRLNEEFEKAKSVVNG